MKIHEYQAKEILKKFGVPVPQGRVASTPREALDAANGLGLPVVVKAQIHAGGRGRGKIYEGRRTKDEKTKDERTKVLDGGVKVVKTTEEARQVASKILGNTLVTHQTGPEGRVVKRVLVEKGCDIERELYLGMVLDRSNSRVTLMASAEGGMDIEEVAAKSPEKIFKMPIDPLVGVNLDGAAKIGERLGLQKDKFAPFAAALYETYTKADCTLLEINPLVVTKDKKLIALDAKINFDDNALFRHPEYESLRDLDEEDEAEIEAKKFGLSYISLNGTIGCMVNGAGLAMATMDIIKLHGGEPANFLDVGGGASTENVTAAFKIILSDPRVTAILVNIFGGIMKCDVIASGIVTAAREVHIKVPVVVRLQGTNMDLGKEILAESGLGLVSEDDFSRAAALVVREAKTR